MAKVVCIVGAGATLAQACDFRPQHDRQHPPLDTTFFASAKRIASDDAPMARQVERLEDAIAASRLFRSPFDDCSDRMESFFADVYYEVSAARTDQARLVFIELIRLYNRVIASTTNWVSANTRMASFDRLLRAELAGGHHVTLVSFNQDLLAENALHRLPQRYQPMCLSCLYDRPPLEVMGGSSEIFTWNSQCSHHPPVRLLKLHGSLNWFQRTRDAEPSTAALFPARAKDVYVTLGGQIRLGGVQEVSGGGKGRHTWHLWPLIVPPIYDKHRLVGTQVIDHQWQRAREAIVEADRVMTWGYSLPDSDVISAQMIRRALRDNGDLEEMYCINPDLRMVARVKEKLSVPVVHQYDSVHHYLRHRTDI